MAIGLVNYVMTAALRDRLVQLVILGAVVCLGLSIFLGNAAVVEQKQFSIVFAAGSLRLFSVCGLSLFCVTFIRRAFENKDIDFLLARPISRKSLVISFSCAFSCLALIFALLVSALVFSIGYNSLDVPSFALWALSLCMEYIIVVNAALFFSMVISTSTGAIMTVFGFYILSRMSGQFLGILSSNKLHGVAGYDFFEIVIQIVSALLPRLDLMAQSSWLVYGEDGSFGLLYVIAQGLIYSLLLLLGTLLDLLRRQF